MFETHNIYKLLVLIIFWSIKMGCGSCSGCGGGGKGRSRLKKRKVIPNKKVVSSAKKDKK